MNMLEIHQLGKQYRLQQTGRRYLSLRESLLSGFRNKSNNKDYFWALKDLNFEVPTGQCLGIIGKNGAGKSTLLKVLSRITYPTTGYVDANGRIASLLEVGTGFHPELSGRENVFLNGAILGLSRQEIQDRFDEIVDFSGVEKFIDMPLKHYSSGMQLRLAFAVAAHLEPEILLIDEVLAVGDSEFQKKCLGKMNEVASSGRTVLFVSHDLGAVRTLCDRVILLDNGQLVQDGEPESVIQHYLQTTRSESMNIAFDAQTGQQLGDQSIQLLGVYVEDVQGQAVEAMVSGGQYRIRVPYQSKFTEPIEGVYFDLGIRDVNQVHFLNFPFQISGTIPSAGEFILQIDRLPLNAGLYPFNVHLSRHGKRVHVIRRASTLQVIAGDYFGTGTIPTKNKMVLTDYRYEVKEKE